MISLIQARKSTCVTEKNVGKVPGTPPPLSSWLGTDTGSAGGRKVVTYPFNLGGVFGEKRGTPAPFSRKKRKVSPAMSTCFSLRGKREGKRRVTIKKR